MKTKRELNVRLKNNILTNISLDEKYEDMCETCEYYNSKVSHIIIYFLHSRVDFWIDFEYDYMYNSVTISDIIKFFCNVNFNQITKNQLIKKFEQFLRRFNPRDIEYYETFK